MVDEGILDGDFALIRKVDTARDGEIVVALIDNEEATLKTFRREGKMIRLDPANRQYEPQRYDPRRVQIQGRLAGLDPALLSMADARIDYVELPSATAHELTRAFYAKAFGWDFHRLRPDLFRDRQWHDRRRAPRRPVRRACPRRCRSSASRISKRRSMPCAKAGGTIAKPIFSFPGGRRFHFIDPSGSELAVWSER